jgi:hypothetical protein
MQLEAAIQLLALALGDGQRTWRGYDRLPDLLRESQALSHAKPLDLV